jgi:CheY-like chemotaxis protein
VGDTVNKILIVDDSQDIRELMSFIFEPEGYEVITAANGREALEKLSSESHPGLIFLDHDMEGMNGPEFISELKRIHPESLIPIIMLTGRELHTINGTNTTKLFKKPVNVEFLLGLAKEYAVGF